MKRIYLTKGMVAVVDDEDFERVNSFSWYFDGRYAARKANGRTILLHRFVIQTPKGKITDHVNGDRMDNRKSNLRICNQSQNRANSNRPRTNTSGYKGVCYDTRLKKYRAYIKKEGKMHNLGLFKTAIEAHVAYVKKADELFGEYSKP